ncbi:hypothetical protein BOSE46_60052 [Bosea sp. 46]|nr:hypothetical protein BOSE46_60052 [Bosea sp. 46]VXC51091.1 hypothetical protein BOSE29B_40167 [Bosea sp. 29B]
MDSGVDLMRSKRRRWEEHCAADTFVSASDATLQLRRFHLTRRARRFCATAVSFFVANRKVCVLELLAFAQNRQRQIHARVHNSL